MPHQNTVFHDLLKLLPWNVLDDLSERHGADDAARRFSSKRHLVVRENDGGGYSVSCDPSADGNPIDTDF